MFNVNRLWSLTCKMIDERCRRCLNMSSVEVFRYSYKGIHLGETLWDVNSKCKLKKALMQSFGEVTGMQRKWTAPVHITMSNTGSCRLKESGANVPYHQLLFYNAGESLIEDQWMTMKALIGDENVFILLLIGFRETLIFLMGPLAVSCWCEGCKCISFNRFH